MASRIVGVTARRVLSRPVAFRVAVPVRRWNSAGPSRGPTPTTASHAPVDIPATEAKTAVEAASIMPDSPGPSSKARAEAWSRSGIHPAVAGQLAANFPDVLAPTAGQRAFLLTLMRGGADVYFKDYMGRGKTFVLALAALSLSMTGKQVIMFLPTPHLAQQVSDLLVALSPGGPRHTLVSEDWTEWEAPVIVATPRTFMASNPPHLPDLSHIFLDEPDVMLGPLPGRYSSDGMYKKHRINLHPPPIAQALNSILQIVDDRGKLDFSNRRQDVNTVWASATFGPALRRFTYLRGWVSSRGEKSAVADLNLTADASERQASIVDALGEIAQQVDVKASDPVQAPKPLHYAFVVDETARLGPLPPVAFNTAPDANDAMLDLTVIEAMAYLHTTSPPPPGTYALALPPSSASLKALVQELGLLGVPVAPLVPEALAGGIPKPDRDGIAPVLVSSRAAMAGLHLPELHTVYMLNGLDMAGTTASQRSKAGRTGGKQDRETQYEVIAGRLGRMGTAAANIPSRPQRVISLLSAGSSEIAAMRDLLDGNLNAAHRVQFRLSEWEGEL